ncbi:hypothetical protein [Lactobacillus sp. PV034]|uniref:hypothetical protein n=1 Tax=Lactobacillus sp. PV034 TaxID=2594495 RepID=UPI00223F2669|nr:hypothetical protein [Lactobacillus sp. PV034]QNQ80144.1 hypothetical protein FP432_00545 [Lactobacillus sp. PV034]
MNKITLKDYNTLSKIVYDSDPKKGGQYSKNKTIRKPNFSQPYKVLDISRNGTYGPHHKYGAKNGMQAMAVAPINKKGQVDYSHITVTYAGTNFGDANDRAADWNNIIK